jgi:hypothetical protein
MMYIPLQPLIFSHLILRHSGPASSNACIAGIQNQYQNAKRFVSQILVRLQWFFLKRKKFETVRGPCCKQQDPGSLIKPLRPLRRPLQLGDTRENLLRDRTAV